MLTFFVPGKPIPQPRPKVTIKGGFGCAYVERKHPIHAYRRRVADAAKAAGLRPDVTPLEVRIIIMFVRPKSHLGARGQVRKGKPVVPPDDVDNFAKAILDAMQKDEHDNPIMGNDSRVAALRIRKRYSDRAGTIIEVSEMKEVA
jgi:Holliday junction resolvase RusA-like endonuclease